MKKKIIAFAAVAFVLSAGVGIMVVINVQPVMAGFCNNPDNSC